MWTISKTFRFDAAHSLDHLPEGHKCKRLHGHTYQVTIYCSGDLIPERSWVVDYAEIKTAVQPLIDKVDHNNLNDVLMLHTTAENIAFWFWWNLKDKIPVTKVDVKETPDTCCTYTPIR
jgi:6-pyruvoyltetrahydropterin/6-carboxytetrahydropterin synthase